VSTVIFYGIAKAPSAVTDGQDNTTLETVYEASTKTLYVLLKNGTKADQIQVILHQ